MQRFIVTIAATLGAGLIAASVPAVAQEPVRDVQAAPPAEPAFYAPFVWNGNALDQKILDAEAEMLPPRRLIRPLRHHRHRG